MSLKPRPSVLICDDEEGIRESFKLILEDLYDLSYAKNALEALEMLKTSSPDAMILDIKMPKMHGMELLKKVKALHPRLPVIIVTGYQSVETAQEAIKNGASDYIPKPFDSAHVSKAIQQSLAKASKSAG